MGRRFDFLVLPLRRDGQQKTDFTQRRNGRNGGTAFHVAMPIPELLQQRSCGDQGVPKLRLRTRENLNLQASVTRVQFKAQPITGEILPRSN
jgi:hypothetical protein